MKSLFPFRTALFTAFSITVTGPGNLDAAEFTETKTTSTHDGKQQAILWWAPEQTAKKPAPLLVLLHTWSGDYRQKNWKEPALEECVERGWAVIHPDFRGPNRRPEACASDAAVQDVLDAVAWMRKQAEIDPARIYLGGTSGGGHMSLMMAGRAPKLWAGVSAWVPISDLAAWHADCTAAKRKYANDLFKSCGGAPGDSAAVDAEYRRRSPLTWLPRAKGLPVDINAGIHDGHTGSVPVTHSLHAFNTLAVANGHRDNVLTEGQLKFFRTKRKVPSALTFHGEAEPGRKRAILFQRSAGPARVTVFQGGHEGDVRTAIRWLAKQRR